MKNEHKKLISVLPTYIENITLQYSPSKTRSGVRENLKIYRTNKMREKREKKKSTYIEAKPKIKQVKP